MDIRSVVDQALDIAVSIENRNVGNALKQLAEKLHALYFDPQATIPILEELAEHGRLTTMSRSEALARFRYSSTDVSSALTELEDFLRQHGRSIFTPSQYSELAMYGREKRQIRSDIGAALDRDVRFAIDELIKLPARYPSGQEPYDAIRAKARELLARTTRANARLDESYKVVQAASSIASPAAGSRWPRSIWLTLLVVLLAVAGSMLWIFARDFVEGGLSGAWSALIDFLRGVGILR